MAYINGIGLISAQNTLNPEAFLDPAVEQTSDYLKCMEPIYKEYLDPLHTRRMSRLIKMGIVSARLCLNDARCTIPDAIITGTGIGSVEDTEKILGDLSKEEKFLNPTPFIQSTYNTISSQIAIHLKCHGYNSTYVHRTFSFESGLQDAILQLKEGTATNVLVGGVDEMTLNHLNITRKIGQWKMSPVSNLSLRKTMTPGALAGEGAGFFMISSVRGEHSYATIPGVETIFKPGSLDEIDDRTTSFLSEYGLTKDDIDIILTGISGDINWDSLYDEFTENFFPHKPVSWFKHLSGEYTTATTFALWLASNILKRQIYPEIIKVNEILPSRIRNILIYNHFRGVNHSLILVRR